jgi:hypothetical protein
MKINPTTQKKLGEKKIAIENYQKFHDKGRVFEERIHVAREIIPFCET